MTRRLRLRGLIPVGLFRTNEGGVGVSWASPAASINEMPMFAWATRGSEEAVTTGLETLLEYAEHFDISKFVGAIIHVSRCGSTALANAFKAVPGTVVLSEPDIFSQLIRERKWGGAAVPDDQRETLVKGFLGAVVKEYPCKNVVVKCSPISTITLDQSLRYIPQVRWCFLSRNPADVVSSLEQSPGMWLKNQAVRERLLRLIGRTSQHTSDAARSRDLYAFLLERFLAAAMDNADSDTIFLDYSNFDVETVCETVERVLCDPLDNASRQAIAMSLKLYSKAVVPKQFVAKRPTPPLTEYPELEAIYRRFRYFIRHHDTTGRAAEGRGT